jgi:predicted nucleic acid-binding protein
MAADEPRGFLVDTNVLSNREALDERLPVARWIRANAHLIRISAITVAEMRRGLVLRRAEVERMRDARARRREEAKLERKVAWYEELRSRFKDRIEPIDADVAERWADVSVRFPSLRDGDKAILATALVRGYGVATRNLGDFRNAGVALVDPFDPDTWPAE